MSGEQLLDRVVEMVRRKVNPEHPQCAVCAVAANIADDIEYVRCEAREEAAVKDAMPEQPPEAVLRVAEALAGQMGGSTLQKLAEAALEAVQPEMQRLTDALHSRSAHPDWDYTTTGGGDPVGKGWFPQYVGEEGTDWRRLRVYAQEEQEAARQPVLDAVAQLRRCAEWLRAQKDKINETMRTNNYWAKATYAQGISNAIDGDHGSLAAMFGPVSAQWLATAMEAYADDLLSVRVDLNSQTAFGLLALAESLEPSPTA